MKLYIVRHGETDGNLQGRLQGWTDIPLNEKGRALAVITGKALADVRFDAAISSPLCRARETCEILLRENRGPIPEILTDDRLKEISFGAWENLGMTKANFEIPAEDFNLFYTDPFHFPHAEDGESTSDVCRRTGEFYRELIAREDLQDKTILLTTHGFALRSLLQQVYEDKQDFWHGKVPDNCAVNIIEASGGVGRLVGDDLLFYDPALAYNPYEPV